MNDINNPFKREQNHVQQVWPVIYTQGGQSIRTLLTVEEHGPVASMAYACVSWVAASAHPMLWLWGRQRGDGVTQGPAEEQSCRWLELQRLAFLSSQKQAETGFSVSWCFEPRYCWAVSYILGTNILLTAHGHLRMNHTFKIHLYQLLSKYVLILIVIKRSPSD